MTKVAVIGVGHLGKQHARLYSEFEGVDLAGVVDILPPRATEVASLYKTSAYTDYRELFGKVGAVSLAVPRLIMLASPSICSNTVLMYSWKNRSRPRPKKPGCLSMLPPGTIVFCR